MQKLQETSYLILSSVNKELKASSIWLAWWDDFLPIESSIAVTYCLSLEMNIFWESTIELYKIFDPKFDPKKSYPPPEGNNFEIN